ncbi:MAG: hypothetical protein HQM09_12360 [Candidatus Riflebacteria bacterium]|nr:hypothetical protein [Candidatus Riflebacteria bacterium]
MKSGTRLFIGLTFLAHVAIVSSPAIAQKMPGSEMPAVPTTGASSGRAAAIAAFNRVGQLSPRDLYKIAYESFTSGDIESARLYALRIFLDGHRSSNQLDLLGLIELKAGHPLIAGEWLRKALVLNPEDTNARKLLARLPPSPRPVPMESGQLSEHFAGILRKLPLLLARLNTPRQHFDAVLDEIARGQFYKALALSEEYEKRYPGVDGTSLTAMCAWYLGRMRDAGQLVTQGLQVDAYHPVLLTLQGFMGDANPETMAPSRPHALYYLDRVEEASKAATIWNATFPKSSEGFLVQARIAIDALNGTAAKNALDQAAQRDPDHPELDLLRAELFGAARQNQLAGESLKRAMRRGYHLPSVNLAMGLFAAEANQIEEARAVLEENEARQPFVDRDAWWLFVRLAIAVDRLPQARRALDEWKKRFPMNAYFAAAEALYAKKNGNAADAAVWSAQVRERSPGNQALRALLDGSFEGSIAAIPIGNYQTEISSSPAAESTRPVPLPPAPNTSGDATLIPASNNMLPGTRKSFVAASASASAPIAVIAKPVTSKTEKAATALPAQEAQVLPEAVSRIAGDRFSIEVCRDVSQDQVKAMRSLLTAELDRVESLFGFRSQPFIVSFVPISVLGNRAANYDFANDRLIVSVLCNDVNALKGVLAGERPDLDGDTCSAMAAALPSHHIGGGLSHLLMSQMVKNARISIATNRWLHFGLEEIAGGREEILKDLLQSTQGFLASGVAKLLDANGVNEGLSLANRDAVKLLMSRAQAYLMVAFLLKKAPRVSEGMARLTKLIEALSESKPLKDALKTSFGITESEFESGWKEAAFWSLKQGVPYEW